MPMAKIRSCVVIKIKYTTITITTTHVQKNMCEHGNATRRILLLLYRKCPVVPGYICTYRDCQHNVTEAQN